MNFGLGYAGGGGIGSGGNSTVTISDALTIKDPSGKIVSLDAFGRLRVSNPQTLIDLKQVYDDLPLFFETVTGSNGTTTYDQNKAATILSASSDLGSFAIRQTKRYFNYQAGKPLQFINTFNFNGQESGITKRVGYFDDNDGIFFENDGSQNYLVIRSSVSGSPVEDRVPQSAWNMDKLDGSGMSGINLDVSKAQVFLVDFQWLGVGAVRAAFSIDGVTHFIHEFYHANENENVYMMTPNLPLRWDIENPSGEGTGGTMQHICGTVISEGGLIDDGIVRSADRGISAQTIGTTLEPVISIRLGSGYERSTVTPLSVNILGGGSRNIRWALILNPTVTGGTAASWTDAGPESWIEYDIDRDGSVTGGILLDSGYIGSTQGKSAASESLIFNIPSQLTLSSDYNGVVDELILCAQTDNGTDDIYASIKWLEVL